MSSLWKQQRKSRIPDVGGLVTGYVRAPIGSHERIATSQRAVYRVALLSGPYFFEQPYSSVDEPLNQRLKMSPGKRSDRPEIAGFNDKDVQAKLLYPQLCFYQSPQDGSNPTFNILHPQEDGQKRILITGS